MQDPKNENSYSEAGFEKAIEPIHGIIDRIHAVLSKPLNTPETRKQLQDVGFEVAGDGPAEFAAFIKSETERWAKVGKPAGIR